jgi:hypothetical protein
MVIEVTFDTTDVYISTTVSPVYVNVSFEAPSKGGGAEWGNITGTLSDQTDLQTALDGKFDDPTGTTSQYLRGDGSLATFPAIPSGTVQSVGLTMPSAFSVANSPVTSSGTLAVTGAGTASQYVRGDGQLANFPDNGGGGSSVNYYLNGSVNQGTFGGDTYYEMSKTPILGAGTNFTRTNGQGNGYIASFITDAGDPSLLNIPGGNWNLEFYFQSSASGGSPQFYGEVYKVSSSNVFTLVASGSTNPEGITNGTTVDQYFTSIPVPQTSLLVTDRLAVRIYVIPAGRTITLHTENSNLCEVLTTLSTGLNALNGLTSQVQYFATGTSGTDFAISSATDTHTFNLPTASSINRGALSSADWSTFSGKVGGSGASGQVAYWNGTSSQTGSNNLFWDAANSRLGIGTNVPANQLYILTNANQANSVNFGLAVKNSNSTGYANTLWYNDLNEIGQFLMTGSSGAIAGTNIAARQANFVSTSTNGVNIFAANATGYITLAAGNSATSHVTLHAGGNLSIGSTTNSGERLQVTGDVRVVGSGNSSGSNALRVLSASSAAVLLSARNDGQVSLGTNGWLIVDAGGRFIYKSTLSGVLTIANDGNTSCRIDFHGSDHPTKPRTITAGSTFAPTSGSISFSGFEIVNTINQTGGANGITRGLYVNPTLTAAADWRAIEVSAGVSVLAPSTTASATLRIPSGTAPTSPVNGDIWFDGTDIKMRIGGVTKTFTLV